MNKTITGKQVGNFLLNNAVIIMMLIAAVVVSILRPNFISEYNARLRKPVITPRNKFFQLPELAERMRERLKAVQSRENKEVPFEGGTLVWNYGEDRLQILFDRIPEDNRRKELKSSGFRWSPRNKAWQRQLTSNALSAAKRVLNLQNI